MTRKTVKQALDRFVRGSLDRQDIFGRTGRVNEDGSVSILVEGNSREVHVRVDGEQASTTARHENRINTDIAGLPVIMRRVHGRLTIIRTNEAQMAAFQQGAPYTPVQLLPHQVQLGHIQQIPSQTVLGNAEALDDDVSALPALPAGVEAAIDHANIQSIGTNSHAAIDTHIADGTIHFVESSIDHANIQNIGTNSHGDIDDHIADADIHFTVTVLDPPTVALRDRGAVVLVGENGVQGVDGLYIAQSFRYRVEAIPDGTPVTVVPDGEINHMLVFMAIVRVTSDMPETVEFHFWNQLTPGDSTLLFADSGEELTLTCTAGGGLELARTTGTNTYRAQFLLMWE